jgi:hypothetical protein
MILIATSSLVDDLAIASIAVTIALGLIPSVICWLKGKRRWAVIGFFSAWHIVAAFRLAKPESWWARRFYDDVKLDQSRARFASEGSVDPGRAAVSRDRPGPPTSLS